MDSGVPESPGGQEQDVTEAVLESGNSLREFRKFFLGGAGKETTRLAMNFKAHLLVKDLGRHLGTDVGSANGQYFLLQIRCRWGPDMKHIYSLRTMAKRR